MCSATVVAVLSSAVERGAPQLPAVVPQWGVILLSALLLAGCQTAPGAGGASGVEGTGVGGRAGSQVLDGGYSDSDSVAGSGHLTSRELDLTGVTGLEVGAGFIVRVRIGEPARTTVWMDDNLTDLVDATVTGSRLRLGLRPEASVRNVTLSADVTVRDLEQLAAGGAGQVTLATEIISDVLELEADGASHITGRMRVEKVVISASGASTLALSGYVGHLDLQAAGTSGLRLSPLAVRDLDGVLSGASCAAVTVSDTLAAQTSGASALRYSGAPHVTRAQTTGASSIAPDAARGDRCGS